MLIGTRAALLQIPPSHMPAVTITSLPSSLALVGPQWRRHATHMPTTSDSALFNYPRETCPILSEIKPFGPLFEENPSITVLKLCLCHVPRPRHGQFTAIGFSPR